MTGFMNTFYYYFQQFEFALRFFDLLYSHSYFLIRNFVKKEKYVNRRRAF